MEDEDRQGKDGGRCGERRGIARRQRSGGRLREGRRRSVEVLWHVSNLSGEACPLGLLLRPSCEILGCGRQRSRQVRAAGLRIEIIQRSRRGMSNEDIAADLRICTKTVQRHMRRYLETDSKYPANLGPEVIELMRSAEWEDLEQMRRFIVQSYIQLQPVAFALGSIRIDMNPLHAR